MHFSVEISSSISYVVELKCLRSYKFQCLVTSVYIKSSFQVSSYHAKKEKKLANMGDGGFWVCISDI